MFYCPTITPQTGETSQAAREQQVTHLIPYGQHVIMLADPGVTDELKLKVAQELSENFEFIIVQPQYPTFLELAIKTFIKILEEGEVHFIAEYSMQQVRKLILEMIHRLPTNNILRPHFKSILALMLKLLGTENEENVLVCLRIIIELHKQYKPSFNAEIPNFLIFVKNIYRELPNHMHKIFEPRSAIKVDDIADINIKALLSETFTVTMIQREKKSTDSATIVYNLIPKATTSLQVLQELPIIVVFMFELYKKNVHQDVAEFIPLIMSTINLQPSVIQRSNPNFNKEIYVDFVGAQIKTLSFLAYILKTYQEVVAQHASDMVRGVLGLLTMCPPEVAHLRKELLVATRHILSTALRTKFVPEVNKLCDKNILLGKGWTTHESLRPFAYSTLADFVHHISQSLPLNDIANAVHLFTINVHDESLPINIQTRSCKLLRNLVEYIEKSNEEEIGSRRELLMRMLEVFVLKFKTISKTQLPFLLSKCKQPQTAPSSAATAVHSATIISTLLKLVNNSVPPAPAMSTAPSSLTPNTPFTPLINSLPLVRGSSAGILSGQNISTPMSLSHGSNVSTNTDTAVTRSTGSTSAENTQGNVTKEVKSRFGFPPNQTSIDCVTDCRNMVKTLVYGVLTITSGCSVCKNPLLDNQAPNKIFHPKELRVFIRLVKWALQALDIYSFTVNPLMPGVVVATPPRANQTVRSSEEKDVLEHFAGVFTMMHPQNFQEIFSHSIEYMVNSISRNPALKVLADTFLSNTSTSPIFGTVLLEYLLERMDEIGNNMEKSNLYLKLFKIVFESVAQYPIENEHMLRPHLHKIVNRSMELAMTAKDPYIYFLLLRALFHSIGGGKHDLLYQEFLPLLPNLLQGLNTLQSGLHKQHMKDLFVELCLTVPVRLSSLLPYLSMLMEPLVSALNGSRTLVCQGLQTLELCVNNLPLDCFYEYIQPVRAELMQALWRTVSHPSDQMSHIAFRCNCFIETNGRELVC